MLLAYREDAGRCESASSLEDSDDPAAADHRARALLANPKTTVYPFVPVASNRSLRSWDHEASSDPLRASPGPAGESSAKYCGRPIAGSQAAGPDFSHRRTTRFHHMIAPVTNSAGGTSPTSAQIALVVELQSAPQPGMPRPPSRPKCR